ncbi:MAG: Gfo/Idh/MocA family oxidoreductase [Bryobacterales bacterium]|nr:Gfo/Idh/MocA family oxidoreductase [Bryobacterales bacterium]
MNRRAFLLTATAMAAPGDKVRFAVVGVGGRGHDHIQSLARIPEARIVAICDADQTRLERTAQLVAKLQGSPCKTYQRLEQTIEDREVDAVAMATCNHWHALGTIWACQAGKDVMIEKPASHNIWEGRRMVEAARHYGRIVQVVHQSRALTHVREGIDLLRQGVIGKVYMARGICFRRRESIGRKPDGAVPPGVDYSYWLGPAPMRPFNPNRFHYNWHWFWDTGNGDIGNQGVHQLDIARWGLGRELPETVVSTGGKFVWDDDQETPNTQQAVYQYGDAQLVFDVRNLPTQNEGAISRRGESFVGNIFYGAGGFMELDNSSARIYRGDRLDREIPSTDKGHDDTIRLTKNFIEAVRTRDHRGLICDIEEGHRSAALSHLANISYRTGRKLKFDPVAERFPDDREANLLLTREYRSPYIVPARFG